MTSLHEYSSVLCLLIVYAIHSALLYTKQGAQSSTGITYEQYTEEEEEGGDSEL